MPVYEYVCEKCSAKFERFVHTSGEKVTCEKCRSPKIRKLFSVFGLKIGGAPPSGGG